jgi:hypothetical protein
MIREYYQTKRRIFSMNKNRSVKPSKDLSLFLLAGAMICFPASVVWAQTKTITVKANEIKADVSPTSMPSSLKIVHSNFTGP